MRDYPSIPSVFRVNAGSTNSVNLIEGSTRSAVTQQSSHVGVDVGGGGGANGRTAKKTEKDLSSVGIELNYHNGESSEYLLRRNAAVAASNLNRHVAITGNNNLNLNLNPVPNNSQQSRLAGGGVGVGGGVGGGVGAGGVSGGGGGGSASGGGGIASSSGGGCGGGLTSGGSNAINSISGGILPAASVSGGFPGKFTEGSDLNISVNSFSDIHGTPTYSRHHYPVVGGGGGNGSALNRRFSSERNSGYFLWIMTPVAASFSVAIVIAALAGPQWLYTEEKLPNANYNGTANFNAQDDGAFITKYTKSSLWILCTALQGVDTYNCIKIDYFPKEGYQPDPHDSTPAIPYTITKSCPFFLASGVFLLISFIVFLVPTCSHQNNLYYFSSGIMFIVSGLFMLIGLIAYISILKAEIGSKLRPRSTLQPALFKVTYGQSFFLYVFGFISTEFVGVLNVFLYISLQEVGYYSKLPCLSFTNIQEKIREGENRSSKTHPNRRKEKLEVAGYNCKKHPANVYNDLEKRYYFEKPQKCDLHSKNIAKSLNELYTEPAPGHFHLPPLDVHYQQQEQQTDFTPLTRSVSTATEIFSNSANGNPGQHANGIHYQNNNGTEKRLTTLTGGTAKKHQGTTTAKPARDNRRDEDNDSAVSDDVHGNGGSRMRSSNSTTGIHDICGLSRGIRKTKDEFFNDFCKRAGVRPKPKDIYFIDNGGDEPDDGNIYIVDSSKPQNARQTTPLQQHHHQQQAVYYPNLRRNSMFVEPPPSGSLRKQNSNLSLHADGKLYQKSLFDLDRCESEIWNTYPDHFYAKGSGKLLQDCNVYQSRTLPRSFMKRNFDSQESLLMSATAAGGGSQSRLSIAGPNNYPAGQPTMLSQGSRQANIYHSGLALHKSCEDMRNFNGAAAATARNPAATLKPAAVQWPAAIPTSPSNFTSNSYLYANQHPRHPAMATRPANTTGTNSALGGGGAHHKFTRAYAFDDRRADVNAGGGGGGGGGGATYDAFDLDEIERERRRSHASLFEGRYDMINGTAV